MEQKPEEKRDNRWAVSKIRRQMKKLGIKIKDLDEKWMKQYFNPKFRGQIYFNCILQIVKSLDFTCRMNDINFSFTDFLRTLQEEGWADDPV